MAQPVEPAPAAAANAAPAADLPQAANAPGAQDQANRIPVAGADLITPSLFVESMVGDSCAPPDVRVLAGYIGRSSRGEGWWRLYLTLELDEWVDVYYRDVLYAADAGNQVLSG